MKVVFYTPSAGGGHARFSQCLLEGLRSADPELDLVLCTSRDLMDEYVSPSYRIERLFPGIIPRQQFRSVAHWLFSRVTHYYHRDTALLRWVEAHRPDVVHLQQEWFLPLAAQLVRRLQQLGARVVVSVHNLYRHESHFPGHSRLQELFERRAWRRADRLIVMSPELADQLEARTVVPRSRIAVVPHFVWPGGTTVMPQEIERKRAQRRALLFGAVRRNKGIEQFIDACTLAGDVSGLVAGHCPDPGYANSIATRIAERGAPVEFRNRFLGETEIAGLFQESSLAVFPYTSFGSQSGSLFMAVAHETPAVGSDVGAIGSTISREGLGLVVPRGDATELAAAMRGLLEVSQYLPACAATRRVKARQGVPAIGWQLVQHYRELCIAP